MTDSFLTEFSGHKPALVAVESAEQVTLNLRALARHERAADLAQQANGGDDFWLAPDDWRAQYRPYVVKNGILLIPVRGVLLHEFPWQFGSWATGYEYIWKAFERGAADYSVKGIALVINSPGGMVAGCFDLVDKMYAQRSVKPVRAFAMEHAYSAAYAIASVAPRIIVSRTGGVGSIGVVTAHVDMSKALENWGVKVTFVFAGKHKVDGNPYEPLPKDVKQRIQARVDKLYDVFVSTVSRNQSLPEQQIRDTEALTYTADEAVEIGLAHGIGALEDAMAAFAADLEAEEGDETMADKNEKTGTDQAALDAARAEGRTEGKAEGVAEGKKTGFAEGLAHVNAVMALPEAAVHRDAAFNLAVGGKLSVEETQAVLKTLPAPAAKADEKSKTPFEQAMEKGNPELGAGQGESEGTEASATDRILADYRAVTGAEKRKA